MRHLEHARAQSEALRAVENVFAALVDCRSDLRDGKVPTIAHEGRLRLACDACREVFAELRRQVRDR